YSFARLRRSLRRLPLRTACRSDGRLELSNATFACPGIYALAKKGKLQRSARQPNAWPRRLPDSSAPSADEHTILDTSRTRKPGSPARCLSQFETSCAI